MRTDDFIYTIRIVDDNVGIGEEVRVGYLNACDEFTANIDNAVMSSDRSYIQYLTDEQQEKHQGWNFYVVKLRRTLEEVDE